jgi:poly(A) polymerase
VSGQPRVALAALEGEAYLVGGAVRDRLLGRPTDDYDLAVAGPPRPVARSLARTLRAHVFELSEGWGAWRVVDRDRHWQIDVLPLHPEGLQADLAQRDLTLNAIAEPAAGGELVDPFGGQADLAAGRLRMVSPGAFAADPLRVMRLARMACELDFAVDPDTGLAAAASASALAAVSPERVFAELRRVLASDRPLAGLRLLDEIGATAAVLPELRALDGVRQSHYHHLDVLAHTEAVLETAVALERDPEHWFPGQGAALDTFMRQPLANELTRWGALRFGALLHDIAKPQTRAVSAEGRTTFFDHDVQGAELAAAVLGRLRASQRLRAHVAALARHHLRLGFLVHQAPLGPRAVYRYLRVTAPVEIDVTVLSVADRLATRGRGAEEAIRRHLALARSLLAEALRWQHEPPTVPLRGDELARELGLRRGPRIGALLEELEEASYAGEITSREEALALARALAQSADGSVPARERT